MTITRDPPFFADVECDECGHEERLDFDEYTSWSSLIARIKDEGWRIRRDRGEWVHICPDCVEKERET